MAGMKQFKPNERTQPTFGEALRKARANGVEILCKDCIVTEDELKIVGTIPIDL